MRDALWSNLELIIIRETKMEIYHLAPCEAWLAGQVGTDDAHMQSIQRNYVNLIFTSVDNADLIS